MFRGVFPPMAVVRSSCLLRQRERHRTTFNSLQFNSLCSLLLQLAVISSCCILAPKALLECRDIDLHNPAMELHTHTSQEHFWSNTNPEAANLHHYHHHHHHHHHQSVDQNGKPSNQKLHFLPQTRVGAGHTARTRPLVQRWKDGWLEKWSEGGKLDGKNVGDYGCGGGLLGEVLCLDKHIRKYTCIDIADRQLKVAEQRFDGLKDRNCEAALVKVDDGDGGLVDWHGLSLDALVSHHVLEHFPSERYTVTWLCSLAQARIPLLALEVRHGVAASFSEWGSSYDHTSSDGGVVVSAGSSDSSFPSHIKDATRLNCEYLVARLPGYALTWSNFSGRGRDGSDFIFCAFKHAQ